ncbi:hypothetical protein [Niallia taxi]|uniref:hypothetical protein n=1 Tax=Niallia taxi TaxID=2499688 RepID=UPI0021A73452|nr:hypothetical protein [Niallia taxi]MCT2344618.1 hypothetical protein [Niallia taxi]
MLVQEKVSNRVLFVVLLGCLLVTSLVLINLFQGSFHFNLAKLVPGLSGAAALKGLTTARKAYKKTKNIRTALKFVGSWSIVSLVIATGGDWLIGLLLDGNLKSLANW